MILIISVLICLGFVSESLAECGKDILYCGDDCGTNCHWEIDSTGVLTVSGTGNNGSGTIDDYPEKDSPWKPYLSNIESAVISNGITYIGRNAFYNNELKSVSIADTVTHIGAGSFQGNLLTSVELPESLKTIGYAAFNTNSLTEVYIPDSVTDLNRYAFSRQLEKEAFNLWPKDENGNYFYTLLSIVVSDELSSFYTEDFAENPNLNAIYCKGNIEKCKNNFAKIGLADLVVPAKDKQCSGSNYYWSGTSCNNKKSGITCAENWKRNEDFCNRIRWMPAEAAEVLRDDNTNEVTITFKK